MSDRFRLSILCLLVIIIYKYLDMNIYICIIYDIWCTGKNYPGNYLHLVEVFIRL